MNFSGNSDDVVSGGILIPGDIESPNNSGDLGDNADSNNNANPGNNASNGNNGNSDSDASNDDNANGGDSGNSGSNSTTNIYKCVLNGPGEKYSLNYINEKFVSETSTPQTVCLSKQACEEIVSKAFDVKYAKEHQPCISNKHTIQLSESEIEAIIKNMSAAK